MELSKETIELIRKEADDNHYVNQFDKELYAEGYKDGATVWAVWKEKAEGYEKALEEIINLPVTGLGKESEIATIALEQFK